MNLTFKEAGEFEFVEYLDENEEPVTSSETFEAGDVIDADIYDVHEDQGTVLHLQCGDGSMFYPRADQFEPNEDLQAEIKHLQELNEAEHDKDLKRCGLNGDTLK